MTGAARTEVRASYECGARVHRQVGEVFAELDGVGRLARHMTRRSAAMLGTRLKLMRDAHDTELGARYGWRGSVLGLPISVNEKVTEYRPPYAKRWCTVGTPELIVLAGYCVGFVLTAADDGTDVRLRIEYSLPERGWRRGAGWLLGPRYARWCVDRMLADVAGQSAYAVAAR